MNILKKFIPASLKLFYRINQRGYIDRSSGNYKIFAKEFSVAPDFHPVVMIEQFIKSNALSVNKIHNLSLAIGKLNNIIIQPGHIFSFWQLVGNPTQKNGYQKSRSIINGEVEAAIGGGLCQLSGLIYFLAIQAGLIIAERHAHSVDIYTEEERFTPLGSDATVAYGYKDLRFLNPYGFPVCISFELAATRLKGVLSATEKIIPLNIEFEYRRSLQYTEVDTFNENNGVRYFINTSLYSRLPNISDTY